MTEPDRALFLVVTIKPRKDRRAEAEAQLQSMRTQTLTSRAASSHISCSRRTTRTTG